MSLKTKTTKTKCTVKRMAFKAISKWEIFHKENIMSAIGELPMTKSPNQCEIIRNVRSLRIPSQIHPVFTQYFP